MSCLQVGNAPYGPAGYSSLLLTGLPDCQMSEIIRSPRFTPSFCQQNYSQLCVITVFLRIALCARITCAPFSLQSSVISYFVVIFSLAILDLQCEFEHQLAKYSCFTCYSFLLTTNFREKWPSTRPNGNPV